MFVSTIAGTRSRRLLLKVDKLLLCKLMLSSRGHRYTFEILYTMPPVFLYYAFSIYIRSDSLTDWTWE